MAPPKKNAQNGYTPGRGRHAKSALLPRHRFAKHRHFVNAGARLIWKSAEKDKAAAVIVWFLLWEHEDKQSGLVEVGVDRLAKELGSDKRTIQRGMAVLKKLKFIRLEVAGVWGGDERGGKANVYQLYPRPYDLETGGESKAAKLDPRYARPHNLAKDEGGAVCDAFARVIRLALEDHGYRLPAKVFTLIRESWGGEYARDKEYAEIMLEDIAYEDEDGYIVPRTEYTAGQSVHHEDTGRGRVAAVAGWWEAERVTVRFWDGSEEVFDANDSGLQDEAERNEKVRREEARKGATSAASAPPALTPAKPAAVSPPATTPAAPAPIPPPAAPDATPVRPSPPPVPARRPFDPKDKRLEQVIRGILGNRPKKRMESHEFKDELRRAGYPTPSDDNLMALPYVDHDSWQEPDSHFESEGFVLVTKGRKDMLDVLREKGD